MNRALLVGINEHRHNELRGCLQDVESMRQCLLDNGFDIMAIKTLRDHQADKNSILDNLKRMLDDATEDDHLVFSFSSHGSQVPDTSGDEPDGLDEILVTYTAGDFNWQPENYISDDEIRKLLSDFRGGSLDIVLDCCHSGSGTRGDDGCRCIPFPIPFTSGWHPKHVLRDLVQPGVALWAGCRSDQTSADALIGGKYQGAMTHYLVKAISLSSCTKRSRHNIWSITKEALRQNGFDQEPQLECSDEMRMREIFT
jgi:metacaspase-1